MPCPQGVPVKKEVVTDAARKALRHVKRVRANEFKAKVQKARKRLWGLLPNRTLAEAARYVKNYDPEVVFDIAPWMITGLRMESDAKRLLAACDVAKDDTIWLTTEEATFVHDWMNTELSKKKEVCCND